MHDGLSLWFVQVYCLAWVGVARIAVEIWRASQRTRTSREMVTRLWRWRDC